MNIADALTEIEPSTSQILLCNINHSICVFVLSFIPNFFVLVFYVVSVFIVFVVHIGREDDTESIPVLQFCIAAISVTVNSHSVSFTEP